MSESLVVDHPSPRGKYVDGVFYYSPNSVDDATLILHPNFQGDNPFQPQSPLRSDVRYADLLQPIPFTKPFHWISFIPLKPERRDYSYTPFREVFYLPDIYCHNDPIKPGFRIDPTHPWVQIENDIYNAVSVLRGKFELPCVLPFLPKALGYLAIYEKKAMLLHVLRETREWFYVWLGALSYCAARAFHRQLETEGRFRGYPDWRQVLMDAGFLESWIDDLIRSPVCQYGLTIPRVGGIFKTIVDDEVPSPSWWLNHGIPFWYPWEQCDEDIATTNDSVFFARWRPRIPPYAPLPCPEGTAETTVAPSQGPGPEGESTREPEWIEFFRKREERRPHIEATETLVARQQRESRTKNPPMRKAKVFEWVLGKDGWVRTPLLSRYRADILSEYGSRQRRYDPFFNEWDCCEEFGEPDSDSESDDDYPDYDYPQAAPPLVESNDSAPLIPASPQPSSSSPAAPAPTEFDPPPDVFLGDSASNHANANPTEMEVEDVFSHYYGFCPPVAGTELPDTTVLERSIEWFHRLLGLSEEKTSSDEYFTTSHYKIAQLFIDSSGGLKPPVPCLSDLNDSSLRPVRLTPRFKEIVRLDLRKLQRAPGCLDNMDALYVFNFEHPTVSWKLAVSSPLTALLICRLPVSYTENSLVFHLAQRGIPFRILSPKPRVPRYMTTKVQHSIPIRKFNHRFTREDYNAYLNLRLLLLSMPHMQAALRRGGIVWRLAIGMLGLSDVARAPTQWGEVFRVDESPETSFIEDTLSTMELDLICGAYECISDDGKTRSLKSWWPLARYYEKDECGENPGHCIQPLTYTQWKTSLHGIRGIRNFLHNTSKSSSSLLASHTPVITAS
ncbi:hypothetical protein MD484_g4230, partial [Candolleomyces efflorescens]